MSGSLKHFKEGTPSEVKKEVTEEAPRRLKCQTKKDERSRTKRDSSARTLKVGKPSVENKKIRFQRNPNPPSDYGSNADEFEFDW